MAFAYLECERRDNFTWALEKLRGLMFQEGSIPDVIVNDRDIAMINAVHSVFPSSCNVLCQFHVNKNVKAKCKLLVHPDELWDVVMDAWGSVVDSPNESEYERRVAKLEDVCARFPVFVDYIKKTWLNPHKEKFVSAWVDKVMHLGNITTNRYGMCYIIY